MNKRSQEERPGGLSLIAQAIRDKRERRSLTAAELEALEAELVADIEAFDPGRIDPVPSIMPAALRAQRAQTFPDIQLEAGGWPAKKAAPAAPPPTAGGAPPAAGGSFLDQLRRQAQALQAGDAARQRDQTAIGRELDNSLRRIFSYCHELVQQLNIVKPTVERSYALLGHIDFGGLHWQEGFTDYRTRAHSAGAGSQYELVILNCQLFAPGRAVVERDAIAANSFRKALVENGVIFSSEEIRNARRMVEKVVFAIEAKVKVSLRWRADLERGALVLESRNLERFGNRDYLFAPEAASPDMLDQFARLLLGQPNRLRDFYRSYSR